MARLQDDGSLDFDESDWMAPPPPPAKYGVTDPTTKAPDPNQPPPPGGVTPWTETPPELLPKQAPPNSMPGGGDETALRNQIAQWANMPGADPSLGSNPDYWVKAINDKGGLNSGNTQYWQDASVGPTAFFNNPNRESSGGGGSNSNSGGQSQLSSFLMNLLTRGGGNNTDPARSALMGRLNTLMDSYSKPVTADDPNIAGATQAYTGTVGRSVNQFKKQAAERAYAEGVPTGSFDSAVGNAELSGGRSIGDMQTSMMRDEMLSRRQALMSTLQSAGGLLSAQDSADIQNKIANMDAALKSSGIDLQSQLGNKGLDIQSSLGSQSLQLQQLLGLLTAGNQSTSINNQNNQFYDQLGSNNASTGGSLDSILQQLLLGTK